MGAGEQRKNDAHGAAAQRWRAARHPCLFLWLRECTQLVPRRVAAMRDVLRAIAKYEARVGSSSGAVELIRRAASTKIERQTREGGRGRRDNYVHPPLLDVLVALVLVVDGLHAARPHRRGNRVLRRHGPPLKSNRMRTDIKEPATERQKRVDRVPLPLPVWSIAVRSEKRCERDVASMACRPPPRRRRDASTSSRGIPVTPRPSESVRVS